MVLPYVPSQTLDNQSECFAVDVFNQDRPPVVDALRSGNLALFLIVAILYTLTFIPLWCCRAKPRFVKVRPFRVSAALAGGLLVFHVAANLSYFLALPCALITLFYISSVGWIGGLITMRSLMICFEAHYARLARRHGVVGAHDHEFFSLVHADGLSLHGFASEFYLLFSVNLGSIKIKDLTISELSLVKNSYYTLIILNFGPAFITWVVLMAVVPQYAMCTNCDAFLELPVAIVVSLGHYVMMCDRAAVLAYRVVGFDDKGVVRELMIQPFVIGILQVLLWILVIIDPGETQYNRSFNWTLLFTFTSLMTWVNCFGYQLYVQLREDLEATKFKIMDRDPILEANPDMRDEFTNFAERHYITESLRFLEDVKAYKKFFFEKAVNWRWTKFRTLVETYIKPGAPLEVNISHTMSSHILLIYHTSKSPHLECFEAFDQAAGEIQSIVHDGAWTEFLTKRNKRPSFLSASMNSMNSVINGKG